MPEKRRSLLDSFALMAFLGDEPGAGEVEDLFEAAHADSEPLLMNEVNIGEVYSLLAKRRSPESTDLFLERLEALPIEPVSNAFPDVIAAAKIKARYPISYADAFAVATAIRTRAVLVAGDQEFRRVPPIVKIAWLRTRFEHMQEPREAGRVIAPVTLTRTSASAARAGPGSAAGRG
jgi:predicted nucleic acid-binding protein